MISISKATGNHSTINLKYIMADKSHIMKPNGMKGVKSMEVNSSPVKEKHAQQVSSDHHPAAASTNGVKGITFLGTYPLPGKE